MAKLHILWGSETFGEGNGDESKVQFAVFYFLRNVKTWEKRNKIKSETKQKGLNLSPQGN